MNKTDEAMKTLQDTMLIDPEYAHTWHCNIAMMCYDAIKSDGDTVNKVRPEIAHQIGNVAASNFMKLCFDVKTSNDMLSGESEQVKPTASEAIYGFSSWITTRAEVIKIGSSENCTPIVDLIKEFCKVNKLDKPRDDWYKNLIHPSGKFSDGDDYGKS